jgi:predicted nucleic acid-binding protein
MVNRVLVDTSFLVALNNPRDRNYSVTRQFAADSKYLYLIPDVVLTEAAYLLKKAGGLPLVLRFLDRLSNLNPALIAVQDQDLKRARDIMAHYAEANLDFVDCCLMALSERLSIVTVCTFDHRDFVILQPKHTPYLTLLP